MAVLAGRARKDPNMQIRNDIRETPAAKLDESQLIMAGERIGAEFDEESDKVLRPSVHD